MAPRANWKGYLKLSLVSCAVALYPASSSSSRVSFNTLNRQTGNKVKRIYVDPDTGEEVTSDDQVKGYAVAKNSYVTIDDADLDAIKIESSHTVDIEKFVPRSEIDPRYMDAPYYIAPDDRVAQEAFAVIREAMREGGMVALARVVIARRERIIMIEPWGKGLLGTVLRYGYEVRDAAAYFEDIPDMPIPADMKDLAHVIVERKAGHWDPAEFEDRYETAVVEMLKSKQAGAVVADAPTAPRPSNVVNLMDALRRSIETEKAALAAAEPKPLAGSKKPKATKNAEAVTPPEPKKAKGGSRKRG
ncbi:non-homologous end joining protein Ku [Alsobacter metallidurans]|uniref:Non-homologous end joining protein Ku n=1 Tax=Alsobacter metallidurans TaxID=340221 RepID=A0A917I6D5_9HYPH|nr:Ku protein [Alsobacter metallidurans]GGH16157.1 non-homologous end joining protein Ku [Alsobacter metallidurans]